jgi:hypothetical protein
VYGEFLHGVWVLRGGGDFLNAEGAKVTQRAQKGEKRRQKLRKKNWNSKKVF